MILSVLGLAFWACAVEPSRLVVRELTLELPRWAPEHDGLRVALLSDLHVGSPWWGVDATRALVQRVNDKHPDLVLLAGDFLINGVKGGSYIPPDEVGAALAGLRAPLGVVAVMGNHDWWNDGEGMTAALRAQGYAVLENEALALPHAGGLVTVVGLADAMTRPQAVRATIEAVTARDSVLVLVHEPDVFPQVPLGPALTLAGHTHGGQVNLPFFGRPIVPSRYGERYAAGHIVEDGRHLYVTTGVGTSIVPVRFRVPPELVVLTLRSAGGDQG